jgi:hypothetical protein
VITQILPSAYAVLGAPGFDDTLGLADRVGPVRRIAVLLVDGLGYDLLPRAARTAPLFADVAAGTAGSPQRLQCTLPSTTPTSLVSLCTGVGPGAHGVLGFTVNVPGTDRVLTHIFWRDDPDPATWQPVPTVFERADVPSAVVLPAVFAGSGLSVAAYRGARFVGLGKDDDLVDTMLATLRATPGLVLGYTGAVDTAAHAHGIASAQWGRAARATGEQLERLVAGLPADAALLVTADHGGLDVGASSRRDLAADARLSAGVWIVAGEPRFRHLHTVPGAATDVRAAWQEVLGDDARVYLREQAVAGGLFGPVAPAHLGRIGDVVVVCENDTVVLASGHEPAEVSRLVGFHGALTDAETAIPLLSFRAQALS